MAANVEVDEANGAGQTLSHDVDNSNMGAADSPDLVAVDNPITPGTRTYIKYQKLHITDMGGSSKINNIRVWRDGALGGAASHVTNARTSSYAGALAYATPVRTAVATVDQEMPAAEPGSANLGIGGALDGELTDVGTSDYLGHQIIADNADVAGSISTMHYQYEETA